MVAGAVVDLVRDAQEPLAGAQLEGGADAARYGRVAAPLARAPVADRLGGPGVVRVDDDPGAHRAGFDGRDTYRVRPADHEVAAGGE